MKLSIALILVTLVASCQSAPTPGEPLASLQASQVAGYGVPAGAGDVAFATSATMGAVAWGHLEGKQLLQWHSIWTGAQTRASRPSLVYTDPAGKRVDLFMASPRDGFCVAFALRASDRWDDPQILGFLNSL